MEFSAHGNINFSIKDSCVINRPNASFNEAGIEMLFEQILKKVQLYQLNDWILIELLGPNAIPTPDAMSALTKQYKHAQNLGCKKVVVVTVNLIQKSFMQELGEKSGSQMQFYDSEKDAIDSLCS